MGEFRSHYEDEIKWAVDSTTSEQVQLLAIISKMLVIIADEALSAGQILKDIAREKLENGR